VGNNKYRLYCSNQTHSSVEKGAKIAGIGKDNVVKVPTNEFLAIDPNALVVKIEEDISNGFIPICIVAALGTTGTLAMDPIKEIGEVADRFNIWFHIDAAYAGSALLLPEYQYLIEGIEKADSFVFNPHKWLFTNFDCSAYFVKDKESLVNTFAILPEYLRTNSDGLVNDHCDWGIPLGRRFRSLKLWFVMRSYGLDGLQAKLRYHIELAKWMEEQINSSTNFEMIVPRNINLICLRYHPQGIDDLSILNTMNEQLLHELNGTGLIFVSHTKVNDKYTIRMSIGQTNVTQEHVEHAWELMQSTALKING